MIFTEELLRQIMAWAEWKVSRSLRIITDDDPYIPDDAVEIISNSKGHRDILNRFANAYREWYGFHLEIFQAGKSGNLNAAEETKLISLVQERDAAKKTLLDITSD